ncbi:MAG: DUF4286 family protein [Muribaculaceae bacterium]|nr:DUF4286 family protein [Muribaculaceae bacterium]
MYIFNITYVIPSKRKDSFIDWAKGEARLAASSDKLRDYKLITVAAIPGDKDFAKQDEKNFSVQMYFDSVADCREWNEKCFSAFMESYAAWHGPNPLFFATILKEL